VPSDIGGFSGPMATDTGGGILVNLYTKPQEDVSIGVRHILMAVPVMGATHFADRPLGKC
jgi:hypothetical protein